MMHFPTITALTAAAFGLVYIVLTLRVGLMRASTGIPIGVGKDSVLRRRVRAHANFAEYVPLVLILLMLVEGADAPAYLVVGAASVFLTARMMHAIGLSVTDGNSVGRGVGAMGTLLVLAATSIWLGFLVAERVMPQALHTDFGSKRD